MLDYLKVLPMSVKDLSSTSLTRYRISIAKLVLVGFLMPIILSVYSILRTFIYDFESSTYTECDVPNIVPSMSAVISAQHFAWMIVTWLHFPFRLLAAWLYCRYFGRLLPPQARPLGWLFHWFFMQNAVSWVPLTLCDHSAPMTVHNAAALSTWVSGCGLMITSFVCFKRYRREPLRPHEHLSYLLKRKLVFTCSTTMVIMWPFYLLHTKFCVPFAYSIFSLMEYILSVGTLIYLLTMYLDFYPVYLCYNALLGFHLTDF